jgi:serine/threonine protein kinase
VTNPNRQLALLRKKITTEQPPPLPEQYSPDFARLVKSLLRKKPRFRPTVDQVSEDPYVAKFLAAAAHRRDVEDRERLLGEKLLQ